MSEWPLLHLFDMTRWRRLFGLSLAAFGKGIGPTTQFRKVCSVCDCFVRPAEYSMVPVSKKISQLSVLTPSDALRRDVPTIDEYTDYTDVDPSFGVLNTLLLSRHGMTMVNQIPHLGMCSTCSKQLGTKHIPVWSIAKDNIFRTVIPPEISNLTLTELQLISLQ